MNKGKRIAVAVAAIVLVLGLVACAGSGGSTTKVTKFEGHAAADFAGLEKAVDAAIKDAREVKATETDSGKTYDFGRDKEVAADFANANKLYRSGDYSGALSGYEKVLKAHPTHFGSNVNIVLAELQLGKNDEALHDAIRAVFLYPDDAGCLLNAQVAATACGYRSYDIEGKLIYVLTEADGQALSAVLSNSDSTNGLKHLTGYYQYNSAWNRIETDMYAALHGDRNAGELSSTEMYFELHGLLETINDGIPGGDEDVEALLAYLEGVGTQLDLNAG